PERAGYTICGTALVTQHGADRRAQRTADVEGRSHLGIFPLGLLGSFSLELPEAIAQHGDTGCAYGMSLRDQPAGQVDAALAIHTGFAVNPVTGTFAGSSFADDFRSNRGGNREAVVDLSNVHIGRCRTSHGIRLLHRRVGACRLQSVASFLLQRIGGLSVTGNLNTVGPG